MLVCGYCSLNKSFFLALTRFSQTFILSPLLINIALDNIDKGLNNLLLPKYNIYKKQSIFSKFRRQLVNGIDKRDFEVEKKLSKRL